MEQELVEPSLRLQDVEGHVHMYEGPLWRKVKKSNLKNHRKSWFRVSQGKNTDSYVRTHGQHKRMILTFPFCRSSQPAHL